MLILLRVLGTATAEPVFELPEMVVARPVVGQPVGVDTSQPLARNLGEMPGLWIRSQGNGTQSDLQVRGSSFSGAGLSLAGVALRNPQTEHFHADLPLSPMLFVTPRLLTGLDQIEASAGHLVGTVDLAFAPAVERLALNAMFAEANRFGQGVFWQKPMSLSTGGRVAVSMFGRRETAGSTNLPDNDLDAAAGGGHIQYRTQACQFDIAGGYERRAFGARGFYGAPPHLPAKETIRDGIVLATSRWHASDDEFVRATALWRNTEDVYQLDRYRSWLYENQHRSQFGALSLDGCRSLVDESVWLNWRLAGESERLHSTYEGTLPSTPLGERSRRRAEVFLLPEWRIGRFTLKTGGTARAFSGEAPAVLPAAGIEFAPDDDHLLFCTYSETVRQPSYTELGYDSPGSLGDAGLERERSQAVELGCRTRTDVPVRWHVTAFHQRSRNTVDWIKSHPGQRWTATNLGRVRVHGLEAGVTKVWASLSVSGSYTHIHKATDTPYHASRYVMDYPCHQLGLSLAWRPLAGCELRTDQSLQRFPDNPDRQAGRVRVDGSLRASLDVPWIAPAHLVVSVDNLWNDDFDVFPSQPPTRRRLSCSLNLLW